MTEVIPYKNQKGSNLKLLPFFKYNIVIMIKNLKLIITSLYCNVYHSVI